MQIKILTCCSLVLCGVICGCDPGTSYSKYDAEWEAQQKRVQQQLDDYDRQSKAADTNIAVIVKQNERFEKVLDKWEEQARRQDAVLDAMEKQHGIKK